MATSKKPNSKKLVVKKKRQTVRQRVEKSASSTQPRIRKVAGSSVGSIKKVGKVLKKEYTPIRTGSSKAGKVLGSRSRLTPRYFIDAFRELKQVQWPSFRSAMKLTGAVFVFAFCLSAIIVAFDYGFERLFRDVILK